MAAADSTNKITDQEMATSSGMKKSSPKITSRPPQRVNDKESFAKFLSQNKQLQGKIWSNDDFPSDLYYRCNIEDWNGEFRK